MLRLITCILTGFFQKNDRVAGSVFQNVLLFPVRGSETGFSGAARNRSEPGDVPERCPESMVFGVE